MPRTCVRGLATILAVLGGCACWHPLRLREGLATLARSGLGGDVTHTKETAT
ncbi:MAG: hypothetical protein GY946_08045 [bacterium]|nr:hypothetical protein [bacterium]